MCNNGIPRYMRETYYAISCVSQKISYVFTYKINITFLLLFLCCGKGYPNSNAKLVFCCGKGYPNSNAKLVFIDVLHYIERNYNFNPLLFLGSSVDCLKPRLNFSHCSLNHSPIGCLLMVSSSLLSSVGFFSTLKISFLISNFRLCSSE